MALDCDYYRLGNTFPGRGLGCVYNFCFVQSYNFFRKYP